jgi:hypothetical protein
MKQKIIFMVLILMMVTQGAAFSNEQKEKERLGTDAFEMPARPGAVFAHDDHNENAGIEDDCAICHHVYENKKLMADQSSEDSACSDCHSLNQSPANGMPLVRAFHTRCRQCHFNSGKGPVLCGQCHIKK